MPFYGADVMSLCHAHGLDAAQRCQVYEALWFAWEIGEAPAHLLATLPPVFHVLWGRLADERSRAASSLEAMSERGKKARASQLQAGNKPATSRLNGGLPPTHPQPHPQPELEVHPEEDSPPLATLAAPSGGASRKRSAKVHPVEDSQFQEFWGVCQRHVAKGRALGAWAKLDEATRALAIVAMRAQAGTTFAGREMQHIPYPSSWLGSRGWLDEPEDASGKVLSPQQREADALYRAEMRRRREASKLRRVV